MDLHFTSHFVSEIVDFLNVNGKTTLGDNLGSILGGGTASAPTWIDVYRQNIAPNHPMNRHAPESTPINHDRFDQKMNDLYNGNEYHETTLSDVIGE